MSEIRDTRRQKFLIIDNEILDKYLPDIGVHGLAIYTLLCRYTNQSTGQSWPSHATIAKRLHCGKTTVWKYLKILEQKALIQIERRSALEGDYDSNIYTLLDIGGSSPNELPVVREANNGSSPSEYEQDSKEQDSKEIRQSDKSDTKEPHRNYLFEAIGWIRYRLDRESLRIAPKQIRGDIGRIVTGESKTDKKTGKKKEDPDCGLMGCFFRTKEGVQYSPSQDEEKIIGQGLMDWAVWWKQTKPDIDIPGSSGLIYKHFMEWNKPIPEPVHEFDENGNDIGYPGHRPPSAPLPAPLPPARFDEHEYTETEEPFDDPNAPPF